MDEPSFPVATGTLADLLGRCPSHSPTPMLDLPLLASALGIDAVLVKDEGRRALGSFKSLGGGYAGLRALARATGLSIAALLDPATSAATIPMLVCASDGNHGLAVSAIARLAGTRARVYLPAIVSEARVGRIAAKGAEVVRVPGTYDDAVRAAVGAARREGMLLVADTGEDPHDPVLADVMAGYGVIARELRDELAREGRAAPTHLFVQAGVGGLAAAMADGLHGTLASPACVVLVEPEAAACVAAALAAGRPVQVTGMLDTLAEMLSCGEASAAALEVLSREGVLTMTVPDAALRDAPGFLSDHGGPRTTSSGAAGLAGLRHALADQTLAEAFALGAGSRVLLLATETQLA